MRVTLLVQRESPASPPDEYWVVDAIDEFTLDEWNGRFPPAVQAKLDSLAPNVGLVHVEIPDGSLAAAFPPPATISGTVAT